jgi:hypothetical protein
MKRRELAALTVCHGCPRSFSIQSFVAAGGLMSCGRSDTGMYRLLPLYRANS